MYGMVPLYFFLSVFSQFSLLIFRKISFVCVHNLILVRFIIKKQIYSDIYLITRRKKTTLAFVINWKAHEWNLYLIYLVGSEGCKCTQFFSAKKYLKQFKITFTTFKNLYPRIEVKGTSTNYIILPIMLYAAYAKLSHTSDCQINLHQIELRRLDFAKLSSAKLSFAKLTRSQFHWENLIVSNFYNRPIKQMS